MNLLLATMMETAPCTSPSSTTMVRRSTSLITSLPLGVPSKGMVVSHLTLFLLRTMTLPTWLARCFFVWEGNHRMTAWWYHVNNFHDCVEA